MPRRNVIRYISAFFWILAAAAVLLPEECPAGWKDSSRSPASDAPMVAARSCRADGTCLEVYAFEGEIWARLGLPKGRKHGVDPSAQPTASVDRKDPLEPELYFIDGRGLCFQIWDGQGRMPKQMRRWIMGRRVRISFVSTAGRTEEAEFSLRGSSGPIKKVINSISRGNRTR